MNELNEQKPKLHKTPIQIGLIERHRSSASAGLTRICLAAGGRSLCYRQKGLMTSGRADVGLFILSYF